MPQLILCKNHISPTNLLPMNQVVDKIFRRVIECYCVLISRRLRCLAKMAAFVNALSPDGQAENFDPNELS